MIDVDAPDEVLPHSGGPLDGKTAMFPHGETMVAYYVPGGLRHESSSLIYERTDDDTMKYIGTSSWPPDFNKIDRKRS